MPRDWQEGIYPHDHDWADGMCQHPECDAILGRYAGTRMQRLERLLTLIEETTGKLFIFLKPWQEATEETWKRADILDDRAIAVMDAQDEEWARMQDAKKVRLQRLIGLYNWLFERSEEARHRGDIARHTVLTQRMGKVSDIVIRQMGGVA